MNKRMKYYLGKENVIADP